MGGWNASLHVIDRTVDSSSINYCAGYIKYRHSCDRYYMYKLICQNVKTVGARRGWLAQTAQRHKALLEKSKSGGQKQNKKEREPTAQYINQLSEFLTESTFKFY